MQVQSHHALHNSETWPFSLIIWPAIDQILSLKKKHLQCIILSKCMELVSVLNQREYDFLSVPEYRAIASFPYLLKHPDGYELWKK